MPPRVSVIMPAFNAGDYLKQAIDSVIKQTCQDFEIIVVNDGSTDGGRTRSIALSYGERIRYIEQENMGVGGALNTGIKAMRGEFFSWLSHDDLFLPQKIERQLAVYDGLMRRDVVLYSNYGLIDAHDNITAKVAMEAIVGRRPELAIVRGCINGCTVLVPREAFQQIGGFDKRLRYTQDYDVWNRMRKKFGFVLQPEILVLTRQHPEQASRHPQASAECNALWRNVIDSYSVVERAFLAGSSYKFFREMHEFLSAASYDDASNYAADLTTQSIASTLVSVIIPFFNEVALTKRALESVLGQTHQKFEVLLIDDGSSEDDSELRDIAASDPRVRIVRKENGGAASARNLGLALARGEYIAFLDCDDTFLPQKIETQLRVMQESGSLISHTSYIISYPERRTDQAVVRSGRQTGKLYPEIISSCAIATPCVMIHRALVRSGFRFLEAIRRGEDTILWAQIAQYYNVLGIDEPLSVVEMSDTSAAINVRSSIDGLRNIRNFFSRSIEREQLSSQIWNLDQAIAANEQLRAAGVIVNQNSIEYLFREPR